jgi:hypothetical protein
MIRCRIHLAALPLLLHGLGEDTAAFGGAVFYGSMRVPVQSCVVLSRRALPATELSPGWSAMYSSGIAVQRMKKRLQHTRAVPMNQVILVGEPIFDHAVPVAGGLDVRTQVQERLPDDWCVRLMVIDGDRHSHVTLPCQSIPTPANHFIVRVKDKR